MKGMKAFLAMNEEIKPVQVDSSETDHFMMATPVWSHNNSPIPGSTSQVFPIAPGIKVPGPHNRFHGNENSVANRIPS
jgi:hypothetical protein